MAEQIDWSVDTRKRMFELINKLFENKKNNQSFVNYILSGGMFKSKKTKITIDELKELIDILANKNPYVYQNAVNINFEDKLEGGNSTGGATMQYNQSSNIMSVLNGFIAEVQKKPITFTELISGIGHEQRHHYQADHSDEELSDEHVADITRELLNGNFSLQDIEEINDFISEHNLVNSEISKMEILEYQFGAYLNNACEQDARKYELEYTNKVLTAMMNDEFCSENLRIKLEKSLKKYNKDSKDYEKIFEQSMANYKRLRNRLKKVFQKVLAEDATKLNQDKYIKLLTKCMSQISKEMTPEEKVDFMDWALENDYFEILNNISFDAKGKDKTAVSKYIDSTIENKEVDQVASRHLFVIKAIQYNDEKEMKTELTAFVNKLIQKGNMSAVSCLIFAYKDNLNMRDIVPEIIKHTSNFINNADPKVRLQDSHLTFILNGLIGFDNTDVLENEKTTISNLIYNWQVHNANIVEVNNENEKLYRM